MSAPLSPEDLRQFSGTEHWYRHGLVPNITYTDGARHVAIHGGAYWLIDEIAFGQLVETVKAEAFQVWKLTVKDDKSADLVCEDGNLNVVFKKTIAFTDFPLDSITLWMTGNVIMLPSEY